MCVVSMIGDHYHQKWANTWIQPITTTIPYNPFQTVSNIPPTIIQPVTREEFDSLKKEVLEMKELLIRAIEYDKKNDEPDCQIEEKMVTLKAVAKMVGVDLSEILENKETK